MNKIEFIFAWDMPSEYLEKLKIIRPNLEKIVILGYIWWEDKKSFYERINFLYFPTSKEGFWIPILESFQAWVLPIVHIDSDIPKDLKENCININNSWDVINIFLNYSIQRELFYFKTEENFKFLKSFDYQNYFNFLDSI